MASCIRVLWFIIICGSVTCPPVYIELAVPNMEEIAFMKRYGYLAEGDGTEDTAYTPKSLSEPLKKMQAFAGIPQTGILDPETKKLFKKRRCGVRDIEDPATVSRRRRFIIQQGWTKRDITYRVVNGSKTLDKNRVEVLMKAGLAVWAPHGGLNFSRLDKGIADIQVSFARRDHGDGFPFDGPGHVVAHAFSPPHGAMHFDDDEIWSEENGSEEESDDVTDFFAVAVHEIGHALGLCHSNVKDSVMYPYYQVPVEKLHSDDILGMQKLYYALVEESDATETPIIFRSSLVPSFTQAGDNDDVNKTEVPDHSSDQVTTTTDTTDIVDWEENDVPDLCFTNYDTISVIHGKIFVFEEEWMWVLSDRRKIVEGYPRRFQEVFRGLPEEINVIRTIYEKRNGNVVIFSGTDYWEFDPNFTLVKVGNIRDYSIPPHVPELTTVFVSNYNNKTYLIEYETFWRYDEDKNAMDEGYPKEMSAWKLIPYPVDGAIIWEGDTYFFRGPRFWRFDNVLVQAHEYYPLPTAQVWFPCNTTRDMNVYVTNDNL